MPKAKPARSTRSPRHRARRYAPDEQRAETSESDEDEVARRGLLDRRDEQCEACFETVPPATTSRGQQVSKSMLSCKRPTCKRHQQQQQRLKRAGFVAFDARGCDECLADLLALSSGASRSLIIRLLEALGFYVFVDLWEFIKRILTDVFYICSYLLLELTFVMLMQTMDLFFIVVKLLLHFTFLSIVIGIPYIVVTRVGIMLSYLLAEIMMYVTDTETDL